MVVSIYLSQERPQDIFSFVVVKLSVLGWKGRVHFTLESFKGNMGQSLQQEEENHFGEVITKVAKRSQSGLEPEHWRNQLGSCGHFIDHGPLISFPGYSEEPRKDRERRPSCIHNTDYFGLLTSSLIECSGELSAQFAAALDEWSAPQSCFLPPALAKVG